MDGLLPSAPQALVPLSLDPQEDDSPAFLDNCKEPPSSSYFSEEMLMDRPPKNRREKSPQPPTSKKRNGKGKGRRGRAKEHSLLFYDVS